MFMLTTLVLGGDPVCVDQGLKELTNQFTEKNLLLHPGEIQHEIITALGVEMDGKNLFTVFVKDSGTCFGEVGAQAGPWRLWLVTALTAAW